MASDATPIANGNTVPPNSPIIVGMGEALWDVLPEGKKIGGAPANFAYHVSQFGFDSRVVSAVGRDELGEEILKVFNEKKLKMQIEQVDYPTGTVQVTLVHIVVYLQSVIPSRTLHELP